MQSSATPSRPSRFIDGVYNYCDSWCERCRFQSRCRVYRDMRLADAGGEPSLPIDADDDEDREPIPAEMQSFIEAAHRPLAPEDERRIAEHFEREREEMAAHTLSRAAFDQADITTRLIRVLEPVIASHPDALVRTAFEALCRFHLTIAVKTQRAVRALVTNDEWNDVHDAQSDANGTAKLVRLLIKESREAWTVLHQAGIGAAEGMAPTMINRLAQLDHDLAGHFPLAMVFVRAGFDTGD
jgi:hypothetical protein